MFFLASASQTNPGRRFKNKHNTPKKKCFLTPKTSMLIAQFNQHTGGWHNATNTTQCPKSRLYNFNALEFDAVYSSIYGNYRPASKPPGQRTEAVQMFQGVFFVLGGTGKGVVWGGKGGFRGVDYFSEFWTISEGWTLPQEGPWVQNFVILETSEDHLDHHGVSQARNAAERVRSSIFRPQLSWPFGLLQLINTIL